MMENVENLDELGEIGGYFEEDKELSDYYKEISEFLTKTYGKLPKKELAGIKSVLKEFEGAVKSDVEKKFKEGTYRGSLESASDLAASMGEGVQKIFSAKEIDKMDPKTYQKFKAQIMDQMSKGLIK